MKNTKILFIRLYIGTLYSNFIVPLRGSNYIQLLYGDFQQLLIFLLERQIRLLVWQGRTNGLGRCSDNTRTAFKAIRLHQRYTKDTPKFGLFSFKPLLQLPSNTSPENDHLVGQKLVRTWSIFKTKALSQQLPNTYPEVRSKTLLQHYSNTTPELEQSSSSVRADSEAEIGADRGKSGRFMRQECYQMRPNATRKQGDQRRPKATKNDLLTYQHLILPNSSFMFCVG